jgi:hypothetical protein
MADKYNFEAERKQDAFPVAFQTDSRIPVEHPVERANINPGMHDIDGVPTNEPSMPSRVLFCNVVNGSIDKSKMLGTHSLGTCRAAFSTVNLRGYNPIMRLRRNIDSEEQDLYMFSDDYYVNGVIRLSQWIAGSTSVFIPIWYDQSGSGRHAVQDVEASMPLLNVTNKVLSINTRTNRFFTLPDGTLPTGNASYTMSARHGVIDAPVGAILFSGSSSTRNALGIIKRDSVNGYHAFWWGVDLTIPSTPSPAANQSVAETYDGVTRNGYVNGVRVATSTTSGVRNSTASNNWIGKNIVPTENLNGDLFEIHIFGAAITASDVSSLHYSPMIGAQGIYSSLKLNPWYSGPIANVRRSSDNLTSDVYVDIFGSYWTNAAMTTTLASWAGVDTLYIATLNDQSGSARNATQVTTTSQPILDYNNRLIDMKPSAWMSMPDSTVPTADGAYTLHVRHGTINNVDGTMLSAGVLANAQFVSLRRLNAIYNNQWGANDVTFGTYDVNSSVTQTYDGTTRAGYVNGTLVRSVINTTARASSGLNNRIGCLPNNTVFLNGEIQSILILGRALSNGDVYTLEWYSSKFVTQSIPSVFNYTSSPSPDIVLKKGTTARLTRASDVTVRGLNNLVDLREVDAYDTAYVTPCTQTVTNTIVEDLYVTTTSTDHNAILFVEPGASIQI